MSRTYVRHKTNMCGLHISVMKHNYCFAMREKMSAVHNSPNRTDTHLCTSAHMSIRIVESPLRRNPSTNQGGNAGSRKTVIVSKILMVRGGHCDYSV